MPPIVLAALRKRMVALAAEIAQGVLFANASLSHMAQSLAVVPAAKRADPNFLVGNMLPVCISDDEGAALRQALAETFADPDFVAEGEKIGLSLNDPRSGEELLRVIERAYALPPDIVDRLRKLNKVQ